MSGSPTLPITQQTTYCHHKLKETERNAGAEDVIHLIFSRFAEKNRYMQPVARTCSLANMWDRVQICK